MTLLKTRVHNHAERQTIGEKQMPNMEFTKKEKIIFWSAILAGMVGGVAGNIWVSYIFSFKDEPTWINFAGGMIFTAIFIGLILFARNQIKKNIN